MLKKIVREKIKNNVRKKPTKNTSEAFNRFIFLIKTVPRGKVATYGQIAKLADYPGYARQVVWTLHSSSKKYKLPWHRIINSQGKIGLTDDRSQIRQKLLLEREGVEVNSYNKIDIKIFLWNPKKTEIKKLFK